MTLTGTAPTGSTVTVSDGGSTALGTATASSSGAWSFTTAALSANSYAFTATDTTSAGTSPASSPFNVNVSSSNWFSPSSDPNLVANGSFATGDFTDWTLGGNYTSTTYGSANFYRYQCESGSTYAAAMGSVGADGGLTRPSPQGRPDVHAKLLAAKRSIGNETTSRQPGTDRHCSRSPTRHNPVIQNTPTP